VKKIHHFLKVDEIEQSRVAKIFLRLNLLTTRDWPTKYFFKTLAIKGASKKFQALKTTFGKVTKLEDIE
jgi:hypothetical protein